MPPFPEGNGGVQKRWRDQCSNFDLYPAMLFSPELIPLGIIQDSDYAGALVIYDTSDP
jgi:hypothetical protein